jgi:hypothetical protein
VVRWRHDSLSSSGSGGTSCTRPHQRVARPSSRPRTCVDAPEGQRLQRCVIRRKEHRAEHLAELRVDGVVVPGSNTRNKQ